MLSGNSQNSSAHYHNLKTIFMTVYDAGQITKRELQERTSLSWGSVSMMTDELISLGYLTETGKTPGSLGRRASLLGINKEANSIVGIDLNLNGITAVATDMYNNVKEQYTVRIEDFTADSVLKSLFEATDMILSKKGKGTVRGIGIAVQGPLDVNRGISFSIPQIRDWHNIRLAELFEKRYGIKTFLLHDPDCLLMAEKASRDRRSDLIEKNVALVRLDQGVGLSMMVNGHISTIGYSSEFGHTCVNPEGTECVCGNRGCLEVYASENGIVNRFRQESNGKYPDNPGIDGITALAGAGDPLCSRLMKEMYSYFGLSLSILANMFPIDTIILYGGFAETVRKYKGELEAVFSSHIFLHRSIPIRFSELDTNAPAVGASLWATKNILRSLSFAETEE